MNPLRAKPSQTHHACILLLAFAAPSCQLSPVLAERGKPLFLQTPCAHREKSRGIFILAVFLKSPLLRHEDK